MNEPPTWRVDRGSWVFYVGAALTAALSLGLLVIGEWSAALVAFALAVHLGGHPYIRREWFRIGYGHGYDEAVTDEQRRGS